MNYPVRPEGRVAYDSSFMIIGGMKVDGPVICSLHIGLLLASRAARMQSLRTPALSVLSVPLNEVVSKGSVCTCTYGGILSLYETREEWHG